MAKRSGNSSRRFDMHPLAPRAPPAPFEASGRPIGRAQRERWAPAIAGVPNNALSGPLLCELRAFRRLPPCGQGAFLNRLLPSIKPVVILPRVRDPRFITLRRGGSLTDSDHRLLALWAATCAEHVLLLFELERPDDLRPRHAIEATRSWVRGEKTMSQARAAAGDAQSAARKLGGAARYAAYAAGQAAVVAHVAAHELGAAAYAIKAVRAAAPTGESERAGRAECRWQRDQLPSPVRELVLDDQRLRNILCWSVFGRFEAASRLALTTTRVVPTRSRTRRGPARARAPLKTVL